MTTPRRRPAPTFHPVSVTEISQLTPRMRRITWKLGVADHPDHDTGED